MAARRQNQGYDPMELRQYNESYYNGQQEHSGRDEHAIDIDIPGTPQPPMRGLQPDYGSDASSYHSDNETPRYDEEAIRQQASLLESLPSRQLESVMHVGSSKQKGGGTVRKRRKSRAVPYGTLHYRKGGESAQQLLEAWKAVDMIDGETEEEELMRQKQLKEMTMNLKDKKALRKELRKQTMRKKSKKISCFKQFRYASSVRWQHFKDSLKGVGYSLRFWTGHLKTIEGHFGTGVTSYFKFLKWLFLLNIPTFILVLAFLVVPQIFYRWMVAVPPGYSSNATFTGEELLTGEGWFTDTEMYYGYYTDQKITVSPGMFYDMQFAYLCTTGGYFLLCLIILGHSLAKSYRKNYIEGSGDFKMVYVEKVFAGWDYAITSPSSAKLKRKSIFKELQEFLAGYHVARKDRDCSDICGWYVFRVATNILVMAMIAGSGYLIYYISDTQLIRNDVYLIKEMAMPLCMTAVNYILPYAFSIIGSFENYEQPRTELYISMVRTMLLKGATLAVLIYFWFRQAQCIDGVCLGCWETYMGQELYRLMIVDLAFIIVMTILTEFLRRAVSQCCIKKLSHPEFNIGRNTLDLIYTQTLCWVGTYFSPFLVLINLVKLFFVFYLKRVSVTVNCVPSTKAWRAARTHTIFLFFTLLSFILCVVTIACSVIFITPSKECGPFRNETSAYSIVLQEIDKWKQMEGVQWLTDIIDIISSVGFIAGLLIILCVVLFYMRILCVGRNKMVHLLKHQIQMEGKDKVFLLKMLQDVTRNVNDVSCAPNMLKTINSTSGVNDMQSARTPDTKTFAKLQLQVGTEHHLMSPDKIKKHFAEENNSQRVTPMMQRRALLQESRSPLYNEDDGSRHSTPLAQRRALMHEQRSSDNVNTTGGKEHGTNNNHSNSPGRAEFRHRQNDPVPYDNPSYRGSDPYQHTQDGYRDSPNERAMPRYAPANVPYSDSRQRRY